MKLADEARARKLALAVLGAMIVIWIGLGGASFASSRTRPDPDAVVVRGKSAVEGKKVFQAYSCMDCHTLVGNGAYFAPDLTFIHRDAGPAWVEAFLASPGTWPTKAVVDMRIDAARERGELQVASVDDYYAKYPGALTRVKDRGGKGSLMPNLPFKADEVDALLAFLKYTSKLDTHGWPPEIKVTPESNTGAHAAAEAPHPPADPIARGKAKAAEMGCTACHAIDGKRLVGPSWKGLYGAQVPLADGKSVLADDAFLAESILDPNATVVSGYGAGLMPSFRGRLTEAEVKDLVAYIQSLK